MRDLRTRGMVSEISRKDSTCTRDACSLLQYSSLTNVPEKGLMMGAADDADDMDDNLIVGSD